GSKSLSGIYNLAPYSYFNAIADRPHYVMFSSVDIKDSVKNIEDNGEFTVSLATENLFDNMNGSSVPAAADIDEFELAGLKPQIGKFVSAPFVSEAAAALECKHWKTIDLPNVNREKGTGNYVVFGKVVGIYINDDYIKDGLFNASAARPLVRLGYMDYGVVGSENTFSKNRPKLNKDGKLEPVDEWDGIYR
ncbi:flavin reductase family protein, partial [Alphaproteobacteria bacterium]|nr:flavin reductase family protein [Alphaproteobacteria bacterium]